MSKCQFRSRNSQGVLRLEIEKLLRQQRSLHLHRNSHNIAQGQPKRLAGLYFKAGGPLPSTYSLSSPHIYIYTPHIAVAKVPFSTNTHAPPSSEIARNTPSEVSKPAIRTGRMLGQASQATHIVSRKGTFHNHKRESAKGLVKSTVPLAHSCIGLHAGLGRVAAQVQVCFYRKRPSLNL